MDCGEKKRLQKMKTEEDHKEEEDRISKLSDDLIHQIMLFLEDTRLAVQTCILSKRWKFVWKTLPYLSFHGGYNQHYIEELNNFIYAKFINYVFTKRNLERQLHKLDLCDGLPVTCIRRYVKYAISHSVETLNVDLDRYCVLSMFDSSSLKELRLTIPFEYCDVMESDCWSLTNLITLYLKRSEPNRKYRVKYREGIGSVGTFPQSCLICLSALKTLGLNNCTLPEYFSLPCLRILSLVECTLPRKVWDFPALLTLELDNVPLIRKNMSEYILALSNLRNLDIAMDNAMWYIRDWVISGYQLVNLKIRVGKTTINGSHGKFVVSAPKLCNFIANGFFPITFEGCELENVEIEFFKTDIFCDKKQKYLGKNRDLFKFMFPQLGSAKNLTLDLKTLQELSKISDLVCLECPFYNLKHLKLPLGCKASSISSTVTQYLLGASPKANIVERLKTSSQVNLIPQIAPALSSTAQNVVLARTTRGNSEQEEDQMSKCA